jgi:ArpU family phage transcriptional regulator
MDYIREAIEQLKEYNLLVSSLTTMQEQVEALKYEKDNIKAQVITDEPRGGGKSEPDDKMVNNIFNRKLLINNIIATNKKIKCIDKSLAALDQTEQKVLKRMFVIGSHNAIYDLSTELSFSKSQIYNIKDRAIRRFARAMYGIGIA